MTCGDYTESLNGLIDGELSAAALGAVTTHLAACPDCRRYLAELAQLRVALQREIPEEAVPPEFQAKILSLLDQPPAAPPKPPPANIIPFKTRTRREAIAWLTAACAVAAVLMVTLLPHHDETKDLMSVRDAALRIALTQTITSAAPPVPGFRLTSARADVVAGHEAQVFAYAGDGKPITLCVWKANGEPAHGLREAVFKGINIAYWNDGDDEYWAATAGPATSLDSFVAAIGKS